MSDGAPSRTARGVAIARAGFERIPAADGAAGSGAEMRLVAALGAPDDSPVGGWMRRYLEARTRFVDRCVVDAVDRGDRQVVIVGAGYDGRAVRYGRDGVTFFEVDHPATQRDKVARLGRLGIDPGATVFVPFDLAHPGLATALADAGFDPRAATLFVCEGLLVYLEQATVDRLLGELRSLAAPASLLALTISSRRRASTPGRAQFRRRVADLGEPARNDMDVDDLSGVLERHGWRRVEEPQSASDAGFVVASPT